MLYGYFIYIGTEENKTYLSVGTSEAFHMKKKNHIT